MYTVHVIERSTDIAFCMCVHFLDSKPLLRWGLSFAFVISFSPPLFLFVSLYHRCPPHREQARTMFGSGGDIKPLSLTVAKNHCVVLKEEDEAAAATPPVAEEEDGGGGAGNAPPPAKYTLECGDGETFINGR